MKIQYRALLPRHGALALALACLMTFALFTRPSAHAADTLYEALGSLDGITKIVSDCIDLSVADPRIAETFDDTNIVRLKKLIVDQICALTGGPCQYKARNMQSSHKHLKLTNAHFNAMVEDLQIAMDRSNIPMRTQNRLLAILAPMQRDVVSR